VRWPRAQRVDLVMGDVATLLGAVRETVATARELNKPYAVAPPRSSGTTRRRRRWACRGPSSRQISQRAAFLGSLAAGASAGEIYGVSACKMEIDRLWSAIERSVEAINRAQTTARYMQGKAARRDGDPQRLHYGGRMTQIIRELKRQIAGEKLAPEQLKALIRAGYVYRNGDEHFLTDKGRDAVAQLGVQPGDSTLADDHPPLTADCHALHMV
jgi:hypothetical protein